MSPPAVALCVHEGNLKTRYEALFEGNTSGSASWLDVQLRQADRLENELPADPHTLAHWTAQRAANVAQQYASYLEERREGAPRQYFSNHAHALYFLQQVAPTKAVDGAWLYGALRHWSDPRYHGLIRTYLEELGDGNAACNHVLIYQRLLASLGCHESLPLADERYLQGSLQLALGFNMDAFLPEVIGYNLGYEQLPLHLLVTAFELDELGIDPHYFRLHITIDNASTGHAHKAVQALHQLWPRADQGDFYRRIARGYRLNDLGLGAADIAAGFDLEQQLLQAFERKRSFGRLMHSDYCRLEGRTVNQWLAEPGSIAAFFAALQRKGWIRRGQPPADSRFWQLVDGPTAVMFGVFSPYEKQLLHDWIAADWQPAHRPRRAAHAVAGVDADESLGQAVPLEQLITCMEGAQHALPHGLAATRRYRQITGLSGGLF
ncbi:iron-containing redox enzyme family protein [Pseudomonas alkylphenolica]|uniref:iron-containing redox enzyme family protein n=1 Tax=Pseudomonas alkylphenolica TaxID=237609 RepID=UPI0018D65332|nr:iron-containing redox enzyme family protein [Pseudomonas alkylphenolica]MBH3428917.1 iron-containing redox enzyme family protein [Pseudomonas alkylphenolica]